MTARFRTFSQAPQAVRSAGGRRWDWAFPACAPAGGTSQADKCDAFGLTVQVHGFRNVSSTAAIGAVIRIHSSPPSGLRALSTTRVRNSPQIVLRYESRTRTRALRRQSGDAPSETADFHEAVIPLLTPWKTANPPERWQSGRMRRLLIGFPSLVIRIFNIL
jgi:hypothetical protein